MYHKHFIKTITKSMVSVTTNETISQRNGSSTLNFRNSRLQYILKKITGARQMAQQLRAVTEIPRLRFSPKHPYDGSQPPVTSVSRVYSPLVAFIGTAHM